MSEVIITLLLEIAGEILGGIFGALLEWFYELCRFHRR